MKQLSTNSVLWSVAILGAVIVLVTFMVVNRQVVDARGYPNERVVSQLNNLAASTTKQSLPALNAVQIMGTTTCVARTISVTTGDIRLSFFDGAPSLSQYEGILQTGSSTVTYDADQYGCGTLKAFSMPSSVQASTSITVLTTQ